ncbi:putative signal transduction response regulator, receiver domain protein [Candidatus Nitrososphaera gargensis Ga9.2]|uniref:Putative signal transduction response regulator, receiver domain protein n=1 Tax=Nitrososphaera gargensis (strain Ga9.2) TaxID=1237085 RepID=K0I9I2_NITGG|nr:response regulator [Candidatus Nitrososphaera gargensis]AFU58006.1 putative signal transduction response regulator, receiver domain protein [Candidatus Nitrososphaera gargensis Ga9.2]
MTSGGRHQNSPPRIMIVDDEKDILAILKSGLETKGNFAAETFNSGEAALQAFASHAPDYYDLILTDIRMPGMNGFELYRRIREKHPSIPIAFITAFEINEDEFSKVMPSIKVKDFIKKPIRIPELIEKLNAILAAV